MSRYVIFFFCCMVTTPAMACDEMTYEGCSSLEIGQMEDLAVMQAHEEDAILNRENQARSSQDFGAQMQESDYQNEISSLRSQLDESETKNQEYQGIIIDQQKMINSYERK